MTFYRIEVDIEGSERSGKKVVHGFLKGSNLRQKHPNHKLPDLTCWCDTYDESISLAFEKLTEMHNSGERYGT